MRVLNLYGGIGGNRKLWGNDVQVTMVEKDKRIAAIYKDLFPNDIVIIGDAHEYLLKHYQEFDFIWSSPPCPTHSVTNHFLNAQGYIRYPEMELYQEIILLQTFFKGKFVVENVKSYYKPLIKPQISGRHYFWANFNIPKLSNNIGIGKMGIVKSNNHKRTEGQDLDKLGFDLRKYPYPRKDKLLKNCVAPEIGKAIFDAALGIYKANNVKQGGLFDHLE